MRYPEIAVQLTGTDGNAFAVMGAVTKALRRGDVPAEEIKEFQAACMSRRRRPAVQRGPVPLLKGRRRRERAAMIARIVVAAVEAAVLLAGLATCVALITTSN